MTDWHGEERRRPSWTEPMVISRKAALVYSIIVAFAGVLAIGCGAYAVYSNRQAISEIKKLTNPTPAQYRQQVTQGIKRCAAEPECRRILPKVVKTPTPK